MTALALNPGFPSFRAYTPITLWEHQSKITKQEQTNSPYLENDLFLDLFEIYSECTSDMWDGYNAVKIPDIAFIEAIEFIELLPKSLPKPELVPDPQGEIGFEWHFGENRVFVVSIKGNRIISFAGLLGSKILRIRGTEIFNDAIPNIIFNSLKRIIPTNI